MVKVISNIFSLVLSPLSLLYFHHFLYWDFIGNKLKTGGEEFPQGFYNWLLLVPFPFCSVLCFLFPFSVCGCRTWMWRMRIQVQVQTQTQTLSQIQIQVQHLELWMVKKTWSDNICTMYNVRFTLYNIIHLQSSYFRRFLLLVLVFHCTMYNVHCTFCILQVEMQKDKTLSLLVFSKLESGV